MPKKNRSKLDPESDLAFASRQNLSRRSKRLRRYYLMVLNRGRVLTVQDGEKFKEQLNFRAFADIELFWEEQILIDIRCR